MEKITDYFVLFTGGKIVWQHINKRSLNKYLFYTLIGWVITVALSVFVSPIFYMLYFILVSFFVAGVGILTFYSQRARSHVLNADSTVDEAKYTLYFFIYIGLFGVFLIGYSVFGGAFIKI
jgi:hypothetical protein